nr:MAG TPA: hypothetical protein [Caudoviricetes sp.]DAZ74027.1 MAG TPA: hypothetical protein [Caudoviricetes sp.]
MSYFFHMMTLKFCFYFLSFKPCIYKAAHCVLPRIT